jgi:putative ABC transport system permease protein
MFRSYLVTTIRSFYKSKGGKTGGILFNYINILGLTVGLAAFIVIVHIVRYELSYDNFFPNSDNVYRVAMKKSERGNTSMESARTYPGIGPLLKNEIPEVLQYTRLYQEECMLHYKEKDIKFNRQHTFWADRSFASVFNLEFILQGNLEMMDKPWSAIISESAAKRFFGTNWDGTNNPIGKTIFLNESLGFSIQGIYKDLPANSHMKVDFVVSWSTLVSLTGPIFENALPPNWNSTYLYLQLAPHASQEKIEALAEQILNTRIPELATGEMQYHFYLQPVRSIHLQSHIDDELQPNGSEVFVYSMVVAAILVLIVAWINFINLMTARALERAKEVGVRKAIGSTRKQLITQFLFEAMFSTTIAGSMAVAIVYLSESKVQEFTQISSPLFSIEGQGSFTLILLILIMIVGGLLSGVYPAIGLSSIKTTEVIKGRIGSQSGRTYLRKTLIAFQFFFAVFLLAATGVIYKQVNFMRTQALGMNPEQVVVLHTPRSLIDNPKRVQYFQSLRNKLLSFTDITEVGSSGCIPGKEFLIRKSYVRQKGEEEGKNVSYDASYADGGYGPALGINFLAGRNFKDQPGEEKKIIINATAVRMMGFTNVAEALEKTILVGDRECQVVGVMEDTHYQGLQKPISPLILFYGHEYEFGFFSVKVNSNKIQNVMDILQNTWKDVYPNDPFDYFFLDSFFDTQYSKDQAFGKLFGLFSSLAIFIACLGLVGLVAYTTYQKTKEIGIRKVLGANFWSILGLLTTEFSRPILIACVVSIPITHYAIVKWLESFAYRYDFEWWMHLIPLIIVNVLAMLAISWQTVKAAFTNPVNAIKEQ